MSGWYWIGVAAGAWILVGLVVSFLIGAAVGKFWLDGEFEE